MQGSTVSLYSVNMLSFIYSRGGSLVSACMKPYEGGAVLRAGKAHKAYAVWRI